MTEKKEQIGENEEQIGENGIDLLEILAVLLDKVWIIILVGVLTAGAAFGYTKFMVTPIYQATTQAYVLTKAEDAAVTSGDLSLSNQLLVTAGAAFGYTKFMVTPIYQATTQAYVLTKAEDAAVTSGDLSLSNQLLGDCASLLKSRPVTDKVIEELGLKSLSLKEPTGHR